MMIYDDMRLSHKLLLDYRVDIALGALPTYKLIHTSVQISNEIHLYTRAPKNIPCCDAVYTLD